MDTKKARITSGYNAVIDALSFSAEIRKLRRRLNRRIDSPDSIEPILESHPRGFRKELAKRRVTIVEAYLIIINSLESSRYKERIRALELLAEQSFHAKTLDMPINTARVQMALMKEAVKCRNDKRRQLELLQDFTRSSFGRPSVIRGYLKRLNLVEVPDQGQRLKDLGMGWDDHVHDNASFGRKTPSQLVIDAFIKGISEVTVGYSTFADREMLKEAVAAGRILGIRIRIGLEFSVQEPEHRFHYMLVLPDFGCEKELDAFFASRESELKEFFDGVLENQKRRLESVGKLIDNFNTSYLPRINSGYAPDSIYHLRELKLEDLTQVVPLTHANRMHLGELLYEVYKPVLFNRVLHLKAQTQGAKQQLAKSKIYKWDYENLNSKYQELRQGYRELNPETLRQKYFSNPLLSNYETVFTDFAATAGSLRASGAQVKMIHPLEHGLKPACELVIRHHEHLDQVEVYNMYDSIHRDINEMLAFSRFINGLNSGDRTLIEDQARQLGLELSAAQWKELSSSVKSRKIIPAGGSDSTGRKSKVPGMGFVFTDKLVKRQVRLFKKNQAVLPVFISRMIEDRGAWVDETKALAKPNPLMSLGKSSSEELNSLGDENDTAPVKPSHILPYLNSHIQNWGLTLIGFCVAYMSIGLKYALIWYGITSVRNIIVDLIAGKGARLRDWSVKSVNLANVAQSLFWTGFSVPILGFVKAQFAVLWPFPDGTVMYNFANFFFINVVNGLYIMSHNTIRGFETSVKRTNFFRSLLSWPFASVFAPAGIAMGIPVIVQAKFWSDVVGGMIEGTGKYMKLIGLRKRDLAEIVPRSVKGPRDQRLIAILDLLYFFNKDSRAIHSLGEILVHRRPLIRRIGRIFRKRNRNRSFENHEVLSQWFAEPTNYSQLVDFSLEKYEGESAVFLVDLVSKKYRPFRDWLVKVAPKGK